MSPGPRRLATVPAVVVLVLGGGAAPAAARTADPVPELLLTVTDVPRTATKGVLLSCPPADGSHPYAAEACAVLETSHGDLDALVVVPHPCTREYHPVAVEATGRWEGRPVDWHRTFSNPCMLHSATGPLFRF